MWRTHRPGEYTDDVRSALATPDYHSLRCDMLSPERVELLQRQWVGLVGSFDVPPVAAYPVFDALVTAHGEPHRRYHTLEHVAEMLKVVGRLADQCEDARAVQLAVWFHDAVYDPTAKDNEIKSCLKLTKALLQFDFETIYIAKVIDLIQITDHKTAMTLEAPNYAVVLDADLAILGAGEVRYQRYAADIRKEYAHVPDDAYRTGRTAVLNQFLSRERIYLTERMFAEGEDAARRNLRAEIDALR